MLGYSVLFACLSAVYPLARYPPFLILAVFAAFSVCFAPLYGFSSRFFRYAIRAGQSRRVVWRLTEQLPRFSRLAFRPLQQLLQQPLQKCNSRESASASRHTKLSKVAKVPRFRRCPSRFGSSPPFNDGRLPSPPRPPTQPYPPRPRVVASSRSPRRFSCLSPAVLTARCHATPSPPSLRSLPPKCRAWASNCRALSKCRVRLPKCRAWPGATAALRS